MVHEATSSDVMTREVEVLSESSTLHDAARLLAQRDIGSIVICDDDNLVSGIVTDRDIIVFGIAKGKNPRTATLGEVATMNPICVTPHMPLKGVVEVMARHRVRRIPVVDRGTVVGIVTLSDVARAVEHDRTGLMVSAISSRT